LPEREPGQHDRDAARQHLPGEAPAFQQEFLFDGMHGGEGVRVKAASGWR
jgi:hypothetical protein